MTPTLRDLLLGLAVILAATAFALWIQWRSHELPTPAPEPTPLWPKEAPP